MKKPTWFSDLIDYLDTIEARAFEPGAHDCALFVAGAIEAMYGVDVGAQWRGQYKTIDEGLALVRSYGFRDHLHLVSRALDAIAPAMARTGDIALVRGEDGAPSLGLFMGSFIRVVTPAGMGNLPRSRAIQAWASAPAVVRKDAA